MPVYRSLTKISDIKLGEANIKKAYHGNNLVFYNPDMNWVGVVLGVYDGYIMDSGGGTSLVGSYDSANSYSTDFNITNDPTVHTIKYPYVDKDGRIIGQANYNGNVVLVDGYRFGSIIEPNYVSSDGSLNSTYFLNKKAKKVKRYNNNMVMITEDLPYVSSNGVDFRSCAESNGLLLGTTNLHINENYIISITKHWSGMGSEYNGDYYIIKRHTGSINSNKRAVFSDIQITNFLLYPKYGSPTTYLNEDFILNKRKNVLLFYGRNFTSLPDGLQFSLYNLDTGVITRRMGSSILNREYGDFKVAYDGDIILAVREMDTDDEVEQVFNNNLGIVYISYDDGLNFRNITHLFNFDFLSNNITESYKRFFVESVIVSNENMHFAYTMIYNYGQVDTQVERRAYYNRV